MSNDELYGAQYKVAILEIINANLRMGEAVQHINRYLRLSLTPTDPNEIFLRDVTKNLSIQRDSLIQAAKAIGVEIDDERD